MHTATAVLLTRRSKVVLLRLFAACKAIIYNAVHLNNPFVTDMHLVVSNTFSFKDNPIDLERVNESIMV